MNNLKRASELKQKNPWTLHTPNRIPFELNNLWKYSVVITLSALSIYGVALGKIIIHELYYRGGFQIIACAFDLSNEIKKTTSIIDA